MLLGDCHPSYLNVLTHLSMADRSIPGEHGTTVQLSENDLGNGESSYLQGEPSTLESIHRRHMNSVSRLVRESILSSRELSLSASSAS